MRCVKCGAPVRGENRLPDGRYQCPGCGAIYRAKPAEAKPEGAKPGEIKPGRAKPNEAKPGRAKSKKGGGARGRAASRRRARLMLRRRAIFAAALLLLVALGLALALILRRGSSADRVNRESAATAELIPSPTASVQVTPLPSPTPTPTPTAEPTPTPTPAPSVHLRAVGDVMSHQDQLNRALRKDGSYNYNPQFKYVKDALSKADYTIANLEMSIGLNGRYTGYPLFRIPEAILDTLKDCGIDLFTTANNHTLDGLFDGLVNTLDELDERGFAHVGTYRTAEEAAQPLVVEINGIRFGFLSYTSGVNANRNNVSAERWKFCVNFLSQADFESDVQALRDLGAEVVVCMPHWGDEGHKLVNAACKRYAKQMIAAGVDIILGSHPHMVQPIELREAEVNGRKKDVLIAWSLGNFISNMTYPYEDCGIILDFTVDREPDGHIRIHDVGYVPIYMWNSGKNFHALCSGEFIDQRPEGMGNASYNRLKASVRELADVIGSDIAVLKN